MAKDVTRAGEPLAKGRVSPALETAIRLIVTEGFSIPDAAKSVGYKPLSLATALRRPHVKVVREGIRRAWMDSQTEKAWVTVATLANGAASEDVRLKAARTMLEAAGQLKPDGPEKQRPAGTLVQIVLQDRGPDVIVSAARTPGVIERLPHGASDQGVIERPADQ